MAVEAAGFEAGDSAPSGCIEQVARACVCACARARVCAYVLLSSSVCCVFMSTCVRVRACARVRVRVFMSGRARVGDSVVVVCGVVWCGVVWCGVVRVPTGVDDGGAGAEVEADE